MVVCSTCMERVTVKHEILVVSELVCVGHGCFLREISLQFVASQFDFNTFCSTEKALTQELLALSQAEPGQQFPFHCRALLFFHSWL